MSLVPSLDDDIFFLYIRARIESSNSNRTRSSISDQNLQCSQGICEETASDPYRFDDYNYLKHTTTTTTKPTNTIDSNRIKEDFINIASAAGGAALITYNHHLLQYSSLLPHSDIPKVLLNPSYISVLIMLF